MTKTDEPHDFDYGKMLKHACDLCRTIGREDSDQQLLEAACVGIRSIDSEESKNLLNWSSSMFIVLVSIIELANRHGAISYTPTVHRHTMPPTDNVADDKNEPALT